MSNHLESKPANHWIDVLQSGSLPEQCAAALALGHLRHGRTRVQNALQAKLNSANISLQIAVQVAVGFIYIPAENQFKMFDHLLGPDESRRQTVLNALEDLATSGFHGTASAPGDDAAQSAVVYPPPLRADVRGEIPSVADTPDISVVFVFPWWFLAAAITLCTLLLRGFFAVCHLRGRC